jgi:hypothetical protein
VVSEVLIQDEACVLLNSLDEVLQPIAFAGSILVFSKLFSAGSFHVRQRKFLGMVADTSTIGVGVVSRLLGDLTGEDLPLLLLGL